MQLDMSLFEKNHFIQNRFHVCDQMCRDQDQGILGIVADDRAEDIISGRRIHTRDRLIEKIYLGTTAHGHDELYLLFRALLISSELGISGGSGRNGMRFSFSSQCMATAVLPHESSMFDRYLSSSNNTLS